MSQVNFDMRRTNRIHPALDFTADHAYVGQLLPTGTSNDQELFLIRDDRRTIFCGSDNLQEYHISLDSVNFTLKPRWSLGGLEDYLNGEEAADPNSLLEQVEELFRTYVDLPDERLYKFLPLWTIGTYFFPLFNSYPYVYVGGIRESGKTKLLTLCHCLAFNSIFSGNMTTPCIYRLIQNGRCSLFIDETEVLSSRYRARAFRNILLNGYKTGQLTYRNRQTSEGRYVPESYEVYGPKMLANIEGLESVLESRCITIIMRRSLSSDIVQRDVDINAPVWQEIRDLIYPFLLENWRTVREIYSELESVEGLYGRDWELWKPILTLAEFFRAENGLFDEMRAFALEKVEEAAMEDSVGPETVLVQVLLSLVEEDGYYQLSRIRVQMARIYGFQYWLNERYVGSLLRRLGFSRNRRVAAGFEYFLTVSDVQDCARRLGISEVSEGSERSEDTGG